MLAPAEQPARQDDVLEELAARPETVDVGPVGGLLVGEHVRVELLVGHHQEGVPVDRQVVHHRERPPPRLELLHLVGAGERAPLGPRRRLPARGRRPDAVPEGPVGAVDGERVEQAPPRHDPRRRDGHQPPGGGAPVGDFVVLLALGMEGLERLPGGRVDPEGLRPGARTVRVDDQPVARGPDLGGEVRVLDPEEGVEGEVAPEPADPRLARLRHVEPAPGVEREVPREVELPGPRAGAAHAGQEVAVGVVDPDTVLPGVGGRQDAVLPDRDRPDARDDLRRRLLERHASRRLEDLLERRGRGGRGGRRPSAPVDLRERHEDRQEGQREDREHPHGRGGLGDTVDGVGRSGRRFRGRDRHAPSSRIDRGRRTRGTRVPSRLYVYRHTVISVWWVRTVVKGGP